MTHNALSPACGKKDLEGPTSSLPHGRANTFRSQAELSTPATQGRSTAPRFERSVLLSHSNPERVLLLPRDVEVLTGTHPLSSDVCAVEETGRHTPRSAATLSIAYPTFLSGSMSAAQLLVSDAMTPKVGDITADRSCPDVTHCGEDVPLLFGTAAPDLRENGYDVIPAAGKVPAVLRWHKPPSARRFNKWLRDFPLHNVGILCGRVVAIDIDCDNPADAEEIRRLALKIFGGKALIRRRGSSARLLIVYRAWSRAVTAHYNGCDILGEGAQFIAFGVHPSGDEYWWDGPSLLDIRWADLPVATPEGLEALEAAVLKLCGRAKKKRKKTKRERTSEPITSTSEGEDGLILDGRDAVLASCIYHVWALGERNPDKLAELAFARFMTLVEMTRPKRDGTEPWSLADARAKAVYLLRSGKQQPKPGYMAKHGQGDGSAPLDVDRFNKAVSEICSLDGLSRAADRISRVMAGLAANSGACFATAPTLARWLNLNEDTVTKQRSRLVSQGLWSRDYDPNTVGSRAIFRPQVDHAFELARGVVAQATRKSSVCWEDDRDAPNYLEDLKNNHDVGFEFLASRTGGAK